MSIMFLICIVMISLEKGISTVKLCAKTLSLNDVDVRAAFARLVQGNLKTILQHFNIN